MLERLALLEVEVTTPVSVEVPLVVAVVLRVSVLVLVEVVLENVRVVVRDLSFPAVAKSAWETPTSPTVHRYTAAEVVLARLVRPNNRLRKRHGRNSCEIYSVRPG